jgi:hypothetical protein
MWYTTNAGGNPMARDDTFETTYPRYDFAPLVEIAIALGGGLKRLVSAIRRTRPGTIDTGLGHPA